MNDHASGPAVVTTQPAIVCLATSAAATDVLLDTLQVIAPGARVDAADLSVLRDCPEADCVILAVGPLASGAEATVRDLRARGYPNALLVVADDPDMLPAAGLRLLGVQRTIATGQLATVLPAILTEVLETQDQVMGSAAGRLLLTSLRQLQSVIAAGQLAMRLQHRLNNPLAALLAEAQLLGMESLPADHATAVRRIVELCRRVIEETKSIEGLASGGASPPN